MSEAPFRGSFILPQKLLGFTDIYPNPDKPEKYLLNLDVML